MSRKRKKGTNTINYNDRQYIEGNNVASTSEEINVFSDEDNQPFIEVTESYVQQNTHIDNNQSLNDNSIINNPIISEVVEDDYTTSVIDNVEEYAVSDNTEEIEQLELDDELEKIDVAEPEIEKLEKTTDYEALRLIRDDSTFFYDKKLVDDNTINSNYDVNNSDLSNTSTDLKSDYLKAENFYSDYSEEVKTNEDTDTKTKKQSLAKIIKHSNLKKIHLNFQVRVAILVFCIIVLLGTSIVLVLKSMLSQETRNINYTETTSVDYSVCLKSSDPYNTKCLEKNGKYDASQINNIKADFNYETEFADKINYNLSYHVVLVSRIYDRFDSKNIVYEHKDVIVDKTDFTINTSIHKLKVDVNIDYKKYNDFVVDYIKKYSANSEASLDAILYIEENNETRRVASLNIPLVKKDFKISNILVDSDEYVATVNMKEWDEKDTGTLIISAVLVLFAILLMIRFTKLIMSSITKKSSYEVLLQDILNTYDRLIVVARDGYESDTVMKVVKVSTFEELLDVREILNKPIIYTKINNVKSEFIVEDENKIYKYIMKEADIK